MRVLVGCEFSGRVREAFRAFGHDAWSCDLLESEDNSPYHIQGDVLPLRLEGLPLLLPVNKLPGDNKTRRANQTANGQNKLGPSSDRWKERSRTYSGIANAMAFQWST